VALGLALHLAAFYRFALVVLPFPAGDGDRHLREAVPEVEIEGNQGEAFLEDLPG
jgi:hypothetical protein